MSQSDKINLIGVSQGGLLARCYVEKYGQYIKPVHSLITYGTPHMGIYNSFLELKRLNYWKNPYKYDEYLNNNDFLVYINKETLIENGLIKRKQLGVKLLWNWDLKAKLNVVIDKASELAKTAVEKAWGKIELV